MGCEYPNEVDFSPKEYNFRSPLIAIITLFLLMQCCKVSPAPAAELLRPELSHLILPKTSFFKSISAAQSDNFVFGWYLTCCSAFGGTEASGISTDPNPAWPLSPLPAAKGIQNYKAEITLAQAAGYDGFALDEFATGDALSIQEKANISAIFEAARQMGRFKLYFIFDEHNANAADYQYLLRTYSKHPNYFDYNGLPVASAYAADTIKPMLSSSISWWANQVLNPLAKIGIPVYWVPVSPQASAPTYRCAPPLSEWQDTASGLIRGYSAWQIQTAPIGGGLRCLDQFASQVHKADLTWIGTFSWHYWSASFAALPAWNINSAASKSVGTYYEHAGGLGIAESWSSLISERPGWVTMLTTNDYQESYGETVDDYTKYRLVPGNGVNPFTPLGWYKDQSGMAELNRFYIQWYKTSIKPDIVKDALFYSYITMPYAAVVAPRNEFAGKINDGISSAGTFLKVTAVYMGYVIPGQSIVGGAADGVKILRQVSGSPFREGIYLVDQSRNVQSGLLTTINSTPKPAIKTGGQPNDSIYITVAAAHDNLIFSASSTNGSYAKASIDGQEVGLPSLLTRGLHQIRIAPFAVGKQKFMLRYHAHTIISISGSEITASPILYDYFPTTGYSESP